MSEKLQNCALVETWRDIRYALVCVRTCMCECVFDKDEKHKERESSLSVSLLRSKWEQILDTILKMENK